MLLRNGEQLLVAVVLPALVLVGLVQASLPRPRLGPPDRRHRARRARPGADLLGLHRPGDPDRLRPAVRRAADARQHTARPVRAAGGQGRRRRCPSSPCRWSLLGRLGPGAGLAAARPRPAAGAGLPRSSARRPSWRWPCCVAGLLRAEAVLAVANLVWVLLLAGIGRRRTGVGDADAAGPAGPLPALRARSARVCGRPCSTGGSPSCRSLVLLGLAGRGGGPGGPHVPVELTRAPYPWPDAAASR